MKIELTLKKPSSIKERYVNLKKKLNSKLGTAKITELTIDITAYLFILLYLYTAYEKIKNHGKFENTVSHSELVGAYAWFISWAVPVVEIGISGLLILPWEKIRKVGIMAATILIGFFALYILYMLVFVAPENRICDCGGVISRMSWPVHLLFNTFYLLLGISAIKTQHANRLNKQ